jgi:integrase
VARENLTDKRIAHMKAPPAGRKEVFDTVKTGLCFRVTSTGARSWSVLYRFNGELRRDTLGPYPKIGLAKARQMAGETIETVGAGIDPRQVKAAAEAEEAERKADTVDVVAERFIARYASQKRWGELERVLRRDVMPEWGKRPVAEITRKDIIELLDTIAERAPVQANRTLTVLQIFFGWCLDRYIGADPSAKIKKPTAETTRERVLTDDELRAFWAGCDRLGWPFGPLFQLLALTTCRRSEIAELALSEINKPEKLIELSGARYKTGRPHVVPLTDMALRIIEGLPEVGTKSGLVFTTNDETPVSGLSKAKRNLDKHMLEELQRYARERGEYPKKIKLPNWTPHDLRRTARSNFSKLGILPDIGERVLGHVVGGIRGVYDRYLFLPEKRAALDRWAAYLMALVNPTPNKVTPIETARQKRASRRRAS